jgi:plastocyanin domain-containing protein
MKYLVLFSTLFVMFFNTSFAKTGAPEFKLVITENGYEPSTVKVKAGSPVILKITRKTNATCAREVQVPSQNIKVELPLDKEVIVKLAELKKGEIKFGCSMDMMVGGVIIAE